MTLKGISYEDVRKAFFENLLAHKRRQLSYWMRQHDYNKLSELSVEIECIVDAIKALGRESDEQEI